MDNVKLTEIVKAAQAGDKPALETLYLECAKPVYYLALKLLKSKEAAEDITQEVFIYVFQKITDLREPGAFSAWLNRITASKCTNALTRNKELLHTDIEEALEADFFEEADPLLVPEKSLDNAETARMIIDIIDALPTPQRVCVYYYYYEHLTVAQIAEILNTNENTVKSRLALARDKIRKELERLNKEEGIKLYGVPLMLTPILRKPLQEFEVPQGVLEGILSNVAAQVGATTAVPIAYTAASAATVGKSLGLGAKIAMLAAGLVVVGGIVTGVLFAVNSSNTAENGITQEEFDRAVAENAALRDRLRENVEPNEPFDDLQNLPEEYPPSEPDSTPIQLDDPQAHSAVSLEDFFLALKNTDMKSAFGFETNQIISDLVHEVHWDGPFYNNIYQLSNDTFQDVIFTLDDDGRMTSFHCFDLKDLGLLFDYSSPEIIYEILGHPDEFGENMMDDVLWSAYEFERSVLFIEINYNGTIWSLDYELGHRRLRPPEPAPSGDEVIGELWGTIEGLWMAGEYEPPLYIGFLPHDIVPDPISGNPAMFAVWGYGDDFVDLGMPLYATDAAALGDGRYSITFKFPVYTDPDGPDWQTYDQIFDINGVGGGILIIDDTVHTYVAATYE